MPRLLSEAFLRSVSSCDEYRLMLKTALTTASVCGPDVGYSSTVCARTPVCCAGPVALELYEALTSIQQQRAEDTFGWVVEVV